MKIGFIGAPNSGKTTVAQRVAAELRFNTGGNVALIDEYARGFVSKYGVATVYDQFFIATLQLERERESEGADCMVTDSPAFLSLVYAHRVMSPRMKDYDKQVAYIHELHRLLSPNLHSHDHIFYFKPILQHTEDTKRVHVDPKEIEKIDKEILSFMTIYQIKYTTVQPEPDTLTSRVSAIMRILEKEKQDG